MIEVLEPRQVMSGDTVDPMSSSAGSMTGMTGSITMLTTGMSGSGSTTGSASGDTTTTTQLPGPLAGVTGTPTGGSTGTGTTATGTGGTGSTGGTTGGESGSTTNNDPPLDLERLFDWQAAVTKTEADYQQVMTASRTQFEDRIKTINEDAAASAEARNKTTADLHAQSSADLNATIQNIKATNEAANTAREQQIQAIVNTLQNKNAQTEANYETETQQARDDKAYELNAINTQFQAKTKQIEDDFQSVADASQQALDSSLNGINATYQTAIAALDAAYGGAIQAADTAYESTTQTAWTSLMSSAQGVVTGYESAIAAAATARDAALSAGSSSSGTGSSGSPGAAAAAYQDAVLAAQTAFNLAMTSLVNAYHSAMQSAQTGYESAMTAANDGYTGSMQTADDNYQTDVQDAFTDYNTTVNQAVQDFDDAVAGLRTDFDTIAKDSSDDYQAAISDANTNFDTAIMDARQAYKDAVDPVAKALSDFRTDGAATLNAAIIGAAKAWALSVRSAAQSAASAGDSSAHAAAVLGAVNSLADLSTDKMSKGLADAIEKAELEAAKASTIYFNTISAPINMPSTTMAEAEAAGQARIARQRAATLTYLESVVGKLIAEAETLKSTFKFEVESTYKNVDQAIEDVAKADESESVAVATAQIAVLKAKEAGEAAYMQQLATLQEAFIHSGQSLEIAYRNVLVTAGNKLDKATATAEKTRSTTKSAAAKTYVDAVADAAKTYVDGYADAWKGMKTTFGSAATTLVSELTTADNAWVAAANSADEAWVTASKAAATAYNTAAGSAYTAAHTSLQGAVTGYVASVRPAWESSVREVMTDPAAADAYIAAWGGYNDAVLAAWTGADGALVGLENSYADIVSSASNTYLTSTSAAAHSAASAEVAAAAAQAIADTAARRTYDDSYATAAVTRAKDTVAEETQRDKDSIAAEVKENDKLAAEYETLVHEANDTHEKAVTDANAQIKDAADQFTTDAYKIAKDAHQAAEQAANDAADAAIDEAKDEAKGLKDRLVAATKKVTAQRAADSVKGVESAINAIRKQMSDLKSDPTADLNGFQTNAGHATIPFGTAELMTFLSLDALNRSVSDSARTIRTSLATSALMALYGSGNTNPGPGAPGLMQTFLGMSTARVGLVAFGQHVGMYDVLDGNVYRTVPNGSGGLKKGVKSMADVQAAMAAPPAVTATASTWDAYFGGATGPGAEVKDILHQALNFFVDDAKLAAPGGIGSDILIAAEVGFGIASFVDPIGIADAGSGVIKLAQGDVSGALIDFGGIAVPFGAEKLLKAAKKAPTASLTSAASGMADMVKNTKKTIDKAGDAITDAGAGLGKTRGGKVCTDGPTCFIAGTKVLMKQENDQLVAASEDGSQTLVTATSVSHETAIAGGVGAISLAAGIVAAIAKAKLEESELRGHTRAARSRKRSDDQLTEPSLPPPDPRSPTDLSSGMPLSIAGAAVPVVKPKRRWASQVLTAAMLLCFTACGWCWSQVALNPSGSAYSSPVAPPTGVSSLAAAGAPRRTRNITENIEDVRLGRRVVGRNPLREQTQSPTDINPAAHRAVRLEMDQHGALYELAFVRSQSWLDEQQTAIGGTIHLVMTEMGLDGPAQVVGIAPCPEIEPDDGTGRMIVTGTMKHLASNVLDLEIAAETEPLGVTDTHPMWSEDRQAFVVAGQLRTGERLRQSNGHLTQITRITPKRGPPVMVYNLEIDAEHVYHVSNSGLLVHNACPLSMDDALDKAQQFMQPGVPIRSLDQPTGVQFIQNFVDANGNRVTKRVGFDVNPASRHVQELGRHLNLQTQINGKIIKSGPLADPHLPIDPSTIRLGDY